MRGNRPLALGGVLVSWFLFFVWWAFVWFWGCLCSFPPHHVVFPFPSMMTWALRPHGVRARGKRNGGHWNACMLLVHASLGIPRRTKLQDARKAAWAGTGENHCQQLARASSCRKQSCSVAAPMRGQFLPEGRRVTVMHGDSKTALPLFFARVEALCVQRLRKSP